MSYEYIKRTYAFQPKVGQRVRHTVTGKEGVISREDRGQSHYVQVRFDGRNFASPCHPMELEGLQAEETARTLMGESGDERDYF